jgi:hypothetical protein
MHQSKVTSKIEIVVSQQIEIIDWCTRTSAQVPQCTSIDFMLHYIICDSPVYLFNEKTVRSNIDLSHSYD